MLNAGILEVVAMRGMVDGPLAQALLFALMFLSMRKRPAAPFQQ
jgi:hypothetical protein